MALLDSSIRLAERVGEKEGIANAYIELGNINYKIHDYDKSRTMYEEAFQIAGTDSMYKQLGVALGNLARRPFMTDMAKSREMQRQALSYLGRLNGVEEEMAYIYSNIGTQNVNPDSALRYYNKALTLALKANLPKIIYGTYNNMAYSYLDKRDIAKAESCLKDHAIPLASEKSDNDWLASLYDTYADVCIEKGDYKTAHEMQRKAMKARDADYRQKALDQVRLLAALLDLKNKEITIQNEEKELLRSRNRLQKFELGLAVALLLIVASVFTSLVMQQRSRARLQKQQIGSARRIIEMEETEKGRTARELHDLTGQLVLGISGTIENIDFPDPAIKEQIKNRIKELGASIRKISHKMNRAMIEHFTFSEMITGLCEDVQKLSRMQIDLEIAEDFPDLSNDLVLHFYRISQELLTNAGKYARESQVKMKVFFENDKLVLSYSDNGPGFTAGEKGKQSMGVSNIFERAKLIGGHAKLDTRPGNGTRWEIVFPITPQAKS
jgi:signal transduction histidine kinase